MELGKCRTGLIWSLVLTAMVVVTPQSWEPRTETLQRGPLLPALSETEVVEGKIQRNTTLVATLVDLDVPIVLANDFANLIQPVFDVRKLRWGNLFRLEKESDGTVKAFEYKIDDERVLKVEKVEKADDIYAAKVETIELETRETVMTAEIDSSLYESLADHPKGEYLVNKLADEVFAWDVDFNNDIQKGDTIRLVVNEQYHSGEFVKYGDIQAAELTNAGTTYRVFLFNGSYYDEKGNAVRRGFLRSPLQFTRISSGFARRRMHPILGTVRAHLAVDYAAPTGTPVLAVASGTVTSAGTNGGYGRLIEIRHANGLKTGYAHLSRIGVRAGQAVKQGEVIGKVGQTGLATGPHLHYMMTRNGKVIDPLSIKSEPPTPIDAKLKPEFLASIAVWRDKLGSPVQTAAR